MIAHLNYVHILVAALAYFAIGSLWYSMLFGKEWMKLVGLSAPTEADKKNMPGLFASTFVLNFLITTTVACILYFVQPVNLIGAIKIGGLLGCGFIGTTNAMTNMYSKRPFKLTVIDSGYHILAIIVASVILTMWH